MTMVSNQIHVGCIVAYLVLGRSAKPFQREVERLVRNNGPEWTSSRMKAIWTAANHLRNDSPELARSVYQENSISYHKSDLTPKGPIRPAVTGYIRASRPSVIRRYAAVLRFYTTLVLPRLSRKQSEKAIKSITAPAPSVDGAVGVVSDYAYHCGELFARMAGNRGYYSVLEQPPYSVLSPNTYRYSRIRLDREDRKVPLRSLALSLMTEGYIPPGIEDYDPFPLLRRRAITLGPGPMGRIGVIQEQGAKARVVAMPSARLQYAFYPLHKLLVKVDSLLPCSVVRDQVRAIYGLQAHMDNGYTAFSTDLSSATDRFPRDISLAILNGMCLNDYAEALDEVSSGDWESPWGTVSYTVGQPMGLYSSFPLFHLSNQVVASYAQVRTTKKYPHHTIKVFPTGDPFYVLGDDIVFSDQRVNEEYRHIMSDLGVEISESKSFSGHLTEFAGFVVTKSKGKTFGFRPYKPPEGRRVTNPIDFLAAMGAKAVRLKGPWKERVSLFSRTWSYRSPDLSPWISMGEEEAPSSWDAAALDNEFELLSSKYPLTPDLTSGVSYSSGEITLPDGDSFTIAGYSRDLSKDRPRFAMETNRVRLGQQPKHPKRTPSPYYTDPLIQEQYRSNPPDQRMEI